MSEVPEIVIQAWAKRQAAVVLVTVDAHGTPNAIYATCAKMHSPDTFVVADNYFNKTRANILAGSKVALLFITSDGDSYQIKGSVEHHTSGAFFDDMKKWNPPHLPGHAAAVLRVEHVFCGAKQLV
jgi:uncharacterized protein